MKIFFIECDKEELKANRGIMDSIVDAVSGLLGGVYGNYGIKTREEAGTGEDEAEEEAEEAEEEDTE